MSPAVHVKAQVTAASRESNSDVRVAAPTSRGFGQWALLNGSVLRSWLTFVADLYLCE